MGHITEVQDPAAERVLLMDDEGRGLRATWHRDRGLVNLSIWRNDRCSETFHLSLGDAARLVGFLTGGDEPGGGEQEGAVWDG